jgi:hypothetical protein
MPAVAWADNKSFSDRCIKAIQNALAALPSGPVLLNSFIVDKQGQETDFDITQANAAYVYDNALAGLALLASGDRDGAERIGIALEIAQNHDRYWRDGRLRNAYQAGRVKSPVALPGWWNGKVNAWQEDPYQVGSETGPVAWAMLLWVALGQTKAANSAADWIDDQLRAPSGYYGGFYGFEPNPLKLTWQSTEQNTDLFAVFGKLARPDDETHAKNFVLNMFDVVRGEFNAGLSPLGNFNPLLAADAGIWPYLAGIGSLASALSAIRDLRHGPGIGFSDASKGIWLEGTAFADLVLRKAEPPLAARFYQTVEQNLSKSGYVFATVQENLSTGLTVGPALQPNTPEKPFNYYRRPALAPTAWAVLAALEENPLAR